MRLLIVDSDRASLRTLSNALAVRKWRCDFASDAERVIDKLAGGTYDVLMTELQLQGTDGLELLNRARAVSPETARVVITSMPQFARGLLASQTAQQVIAKPYDPSALVRDIESVLRMQQLLSDKVVRKHLGGLKRIPANPSLHLELCTELSSAACSAARVAAIVNRDPGLAAKLLATVNTSFGDRLPRPVTAMAHAVSVLGFDAVRCLVLSMELESFSHPDELSTPSFQAHSHQVATLAVRLAPESLREKAFAAAMLHDIGLVIFASARKNNFSRMMRMATKSKRPIFAVERELFPVTHAEIGAFVLGRWGLPLEVAEAVAFHHEPSRLNSSELHLAGLIHIADYFAGQYSPPFQSSELAGLDEAFIEGAELGDKIEKWGPAAERILAQLEAAK